MALLAAVVTFGMLAAAPVWASPISDKQAQAQNLQAQINSTGDRIAALGERYDGAVLAADEATKAIADSEQRLAAAQNEWNVAKVALGRKAAALYLAAAQQTPLGEVDVASVTDLMSRSRYTAAVQDRDRALMGTISAARQDLETRRRDLQAARVEAERQRDTLLQTRKDLEGENAREASLLSQVKGDLARLIAQQRARDEAAARARAAAMAARLASGTAPVANGNGHGRPAAGPATWIGPYTPIPNVPPPSKGAAIAVAYARAQLGKPYVYDTAGPDTFDCSGLSMMAWAAAGVSMPHYSGAQFAMFPHVPLGALEPGDLVFKGPGGSEHVAIYVGNGMQIAATHTGSYVLLQPVDYA
ncbi:MAG: C40 family peptidase, partial [Actinobacteria bacterium]|nr:C40 family peptidase [Actinomycetota bacterium]